MKFQIEKKSSKKCECGANLYTSTVIRYLDMTKYFCKKCHARYKYWWRSGELVKEIKFKLR